MRVLEVSDREEAGAFCGKLLARWGAQVTRLEPMGRGEPARSEVMYLHGGKALESADLDRPEGMERLRSLVAEADVVVCDLPVDRMEALLPTLEGARVRLLLTPFGRTGPYRDAPATAATLLALGGHTFLSGDPGREPLTMPGKYPYYQAGSYGYVAAVAAYLRAEDPVTIDVSILETLATLHQFTDTMWTFGGIVRSRHGSRWENLCPTTLLPAQDGWVAVNILPNFWESFALWVGGPEFAADERFATNEARMAHRDETEAVIIEFFKDLQMEDIFREGQEVWRVPIGYAPSLRQTMQDRHLVEREFFRPLPQEAPGLLRTAGSPFRFVGEDPPVERPPGEPAPLATEWRPTPRGDAPASRPLEGIRVVDLTRIWSGPLATRILGDLGADIVKIEAPTGRGPRQGQMAAAGGTGAPPPSGAPDRPWNRQGLFNKLNRNKSSVAVDLKDPRGREMFLRLVAESDVVIENFSTRAMPSLGLGYDALREVNPRIIYAPMPALGSFGPYRDYIGLGPSIEPLSGLTALMGYGPDEPRLTAKAITDAAAGVTAAVEILTALWRRERTGEGARIDISQGEAMSAYLGEFFIEAQLAEQEPPRLGNAHPRMAPHGVYRCAGDDEWIAIGARTEAEWRALAETAGRGWADDSRFATLDARLEHRAALDQAIAAWTQGEDKMALMRTLLERGVPAGAVYSAPEMLSDAHLEARRYFAELETPHSGRHRYDGSPLVFNGERGYEYWRGAPALGEHNDPVLERLGYDAAEVRDLYGAGVLVDAPPV